MRLVRRGKKGLEQVRPNPYSGDGLPDSYKQVQVKAALLVSRGLKADGLRRGGIRPPAGRSLVRDERYGTREAIVHHAKGCDGAGSARRLAAASSGGGPTRRAPRQQQYRFARDPCTRLALGLVLLCVFSIRTAAVVRNWRRLSAAPAKNKTWVAGWLRGQGARKVPARC